MRALFIYWKVLPEQLAGALHAARLFQRGVQQQHPALAAQLYQRADTSEATVTVMETYTLPGGLDAHLQRAIIDGGQAALAPWCSGRRHVEQFDELLA